MLRTLAILGSMLLAGQCANATPPKILHTLPSMPEGIEASQLRALRSVFEFAGRDTEYEYVLSRITRTIESLDIDKDGITREAIRREHLVNQAKSLAVQVERFFRYDLDGDGAVTRDEIREVAIQDGTIDTTFSSTLISIASQDTNGDKITEWIEISQSPASVRTIPKEIEAILTLAETIDPDRPFDIQDLKDFLDSIYAAFDLDSDGIMQSAEALDMLRLSADQAKTGEGHPEPCAPWFPESFSDDTHLCKASWRLGPVMFGGTDQDWPGWRYMGEPIP